ncbi:MAG TPA: hypothetical protein VGC79_31750 [Polyangiaceae bacterium]
MFESTAPSSHPPPPPASRGPAHSKFAHLHCDCAAHRAVLVQLPRRARNGSVAATLLPLLVCAFCPACIALWAPLLASVGLGFALPESVHSVGLGIAIAVAVAPAAWHAWRARVWQPVLFVLVGAGVFVATHALDGGRLSEVLGALSLVSGSFLERRARRTQPARAVS